MTRVAQTELQSRFAATADTTFDLAEQVELVRSVARRLVMRDGIEAGGGNLDPIYAIAGEREGDVGDWLYFCRCVSAAYALGIAVGQLVDRDVLTTGAAR
jgi:hypothetical protein